ncbi:MAG: phosphatidate cytidylyltransferase [Lentisphaeria bacterium]|nr:phosphatidate cytidylyltransferase [Lentisphaeria bacterium]
MLKQRLISGLSIGGVCLLAFLSPGLTGGLLFTFLCMALIWIVLGEYAALSAKLGLPTMRLPMRIGGLVLMLALAWRPLIHNLPPYPLEEAAVLFMVLLSTAFIAVSGKDLRLSMVSWLVTLGGMLLLYGTLRFIPALYFREGLGMHGRLLVLFALVVTKFGDIGAYTLGVLTARKSGGNHKLWPRVSPKKSWEGLAGGVMASVVLAWLMLMVMPDSVGRLFGDGFVARLFFSAVTAVVLTGTGLLGDLTESALKRAAGVKDSGAVPGLGGVFDFVDSLVFNAPLFWLFVVWRGS